MKEFYIRNSRLYSCVRSYFNKRDFIEVNTPLIVKTPGIETYLRYFQTEWVNYKNQPHELFLRSSPEVHMKKLLYSGLDKIYEIGKCFRNHGEYSKLHNPEFTMLEWYDSNISYKDFMAQTIELLDYVSSSMLSAKLVQKKISKSSFTFISFQEMFKRYSGLELIDNDENLGEKAAKLGIASCNIVDDFQTSMHKILLSVIEPKLESLGNIVLYDFPASQAALAKIKGEVAQRFEIYVDGVELCNAYNEELNSKENLKRFNKILKQRQELGYEIHELDTDFINALASTEKLNVCGNALGLDRLMMILTGCKSIDSFNSNHIYC